MLESSTSTSAPQIDTIVARLRDDEEFFARATGLFECLVALDPADRIERLQGEDSFLRGAVSWLLREDRANDSFLRQPVSELGPGEPEVQSMMGREIAGYRVGDLLGEGGSSRVFLGIRADGAFEGKVAIKLLRSEAQNSDLRRRFSRERQILASLDHVGIARILDGGTAGDGTPYLVMEYVDGSPIVDHCDQRSLGIEARLKLFRRVCDAVDYAHQQLVIHRDLKSGNILIDPKGRPKLLDFGIAKILEMSHENDPTATHLRAMTLAYASPEQLIGQRLTTATDVYSLGVLLFELLAGEYPQSRSGKSLSEIVEEIRFDEVKRCSDSYGPARSDRSQRARTRGAKSKELCSRIAGDLDAVVAKCLRFEAERRYRSARELGEEIERFLEDRPVLARPSGPMYRFRKLVQRRPLTMAAIVLIATVTSLLVWQVRSVRAEREVAREQRQQAEWVTEFIIESFYSAGVEPDDTEGVSLSHLLDRVIDRVESEFAAEPSIYAELQRSIGRINIALGRFEEGSEQLGRARQSFDQTLQASEDVARTSRLLGESYLEQNNFGASRAALEQALQLYSSVEGGALGEAATKRALADLALTEGDFEISQRFLEEALATLPGSHGASDLERARIQNLLGLVLLRIGEFEAAEEHSRAALEIRQRELGPGHSESATSINNLAQILGAKGEIEETEALYRDGLRTWRSIHGDKHPLVALGLSNLGALLHRKGRFEEAERFLRESFSLAAELHGEEHIRVLMSRNNLAAVLTERGRFSEAVDLYRTNLQAVTRLVGPEHEYSLLAQNNLAWTLQEHGEYTESRLLHEDALPKMQAVFGDRHIHVAQVHENLGYLSLKLGKIDQAIEFLTHAFELRTELLGGEHGDTGSTRSYLAAAQLRAGLLTEAAVNAREAVRIQEQAFPAGHWRIAEARSVLGECLLHSGETERALGLLEPAVRELEAARGPDAFASRQARSALRQLSASQALGSTKGQMDAELDPPLREEK